MNAGFDACTKMIKKQSCYSEAGHISIFKISDIEKLFGFMENNQITQRIIIAIKDVIYQKRKKGNKMAMNDVKRGLLKKT